MCWYKIWIQKKGYYKRLILHNTNDKGFDILRFTISPHQSYITVTSTKNWRRKVIKPAAMQKEEVLDCVDIVETNFVYQMNNACHESNSLESVQKYDESDNQALQFGDES